MYKQTNTTQKRAQLLENVLRFFVWTCLLGAVVAGASSLPVGKAVLSGRITDSEDGRPVSGAQVFVAGADVGSKTNSKGIYRIQGLVEGYYVLKITSQGYETQLIPDVDVPQEGTVVKDAVLSALPGIRNSGTGSLSGKILDESTGEPLVGTNVVLLGTRTGTMSDLDGFFQIKNVIPGPYRVQLSYMGYRTLTIDAVKVEPGKNTAIHTALSPSVLELKEIVITAEALKTSELSVLNLQRNSDRILDGVSAELIGKNNSSDGTDVLKRISGIALSEGRYAYIRGIGDRYNNTLLNGSLLPSTDPEKKSFSYDLFPASLIENLLTSKTATPDKPADFTGGLVEIQTIEFPEKRLFTFSSSTTYNSRTRFHEFAASEGGRWDWVGFDDGTRTMPGLIGPEKVGKGYYTPQQLREIGQAFRNNWDSNKIRTPFNGDFRIGLGNSHAVGSGVFGYIASMNYAHRDEIQSLEKANYTFEGPRYHYQGTNFGNSVSWSAMLNMSLKLGRNHKLSLKNLYNRNMENETTTFEGPYYYFPDYRRISSTRFVSRALASSQFMGRHHFGIWNGLGIDWNLNAGASRRDEPDARRYVYNRDLSAPDEAFRFLLDPSISTRFFGELDDRHGGMNANFSLQPFRDPALPVFKTGFGYDRKEREFDARTFGFWNLPGGNFIAEDQAMLAEVSDIFSPENFNEKFIEVLEITKPADSYSADQDVHSAFGSLSFHWWSRIKLLAGARFERSRQMLDSKDVTNQPVRVRATYNDWLPSLNLSYELPRGMQVRAALSRTLARPEFRELAPFSYFDFLANELVQGNPHLRRSLITNYDLRFEWYLNRGQMLAFSGFRKEFDDPIEQILIAASGFEPIRSYENADRATNYGMEVEWRKRLDFLHSLLDAVSFSGNISLIHSEINLRSGGFQAQRRPLQGQADYISNLGLYYDSFNSRISASLIYNKVGKRISRVGFANLGDIIEMPRDQVDFSVSYALSKSLTVKAAVKDILDQDHVFIQRTPDGDRTAERRQIGRTVSIGISMQ
jgi:outer membrane receptor protein involved in Fe transport